MELAPCCGRCLALLAALLLASPWSHPACARAVSKNLKPPWNVQIHIVDPKFTVKWDWHTNPTADVGKVTFSAYYQQPNVNDTEWNALSGCYNVTATMCDFAAELDMFESYNIRVQAKRGNTTSRWSTVVPFVLWDIAVPGPPSAVQIEPVDDSINLNISAPESLKVFDAADFMYEVEIWKNASAEQPTTKQICALDTIDGLSLNTTYCLKVLPFVLPPRREGPFSPVSCIQTAEKVRKNCPERVHIDAVNTKFVLKWDWKKSYDRNVSFTVQYTRHSCIIYGSNIWESIADCEDIVTTECDFSFKIPVFGIYYFRVMATSGAKSPVWSKNIMFEPLKNTEIGPPSHVNVNFIDGLLQITMGPPGESENNAMTEYFTFSYNVLLWKNSSLMEKMNKNENQTFFMFPDLEPLTVYCLQAQAVVIGQNKVGRFSDVQCITAPAGNSSFWETLAMFILSAVAAFLAVVAICVMLYTVKKAVTYTFFPSCKLPSNIKECLHEQHMNKTFPIYAEEHTETCHVIQNMITEDANRMDNSLGSQDSKKSSRDSGNYSNEEEPGGAV